MSGFKGFAYDNLPPVSMLVGLPIDHFDTSSQQFLLRIQ
jgi:hypothetical protein